jgi:hypothetical protein
LGGRDLAILGVLQVVTALLVPFWPAISPVAYSLINTALLAIGAIVLAIVSLISAERLLKHRQARL